MLKILGPAATKLCDGLTRRELLHVGGLSLLGRLTLPGYLRARARVSGQHRHVGPAKSVIMFNLLGGPSHQDMFDMKPEMPVEVRGEFRPIATSLPGLQICEHLPQAARLMHKATVIRSVTHTYNAHNPLAMMTGYIGENLQIFTKASDPPDIGAVCQYMGLGPRDLPGAVCMPCYPGWGEGIKRPGPYGGWLGSQYDPLFSVCQPKFERKPRRPHYDPVPDLGDPQMPSLDSMPDLTPLRLGSRRALTEQFDHMFKTAATSPAMDRLDHFQERAFAMLSSSKTREAFDLSSEPDRLRDRYGRTLSGSSLLVARRLVERGVPFVSVHSSIFGEMGHAYDMHENNFGMLKDVNLPILDAGYSTLIQDLEERGLLESTLVVVMGEMGRSPKVNRAAGRDHWPQCGFSLLTGGGVKKGCVYGSSDKMAAYPKDNPVSPADLVATMYQLLGIDPHLMLPDRTNRPIAVAHGGQVVQGVLQ
jgi:hypothetical protein